MRRPVQGVDPVAVVPAKSVALRGDVKSLIEPESVFPTENGKPAAQKIRVLFIPRGVKA
jgi:hypothetical protein